MENKLPLEYERGVLKYYNIQYPIHRYHSFFTGTTETAMYVALSATPGNSLNLKAIWGSPGDRGTRFEFDWSGVRFFSSAVRLYASVC